MADKIMMPHFEKLDGTNWLFWRQAMRQYFRVHGLSNYVFNTVQRPATISDSATSWDKQDGIAGLAILSAIDANQQPFVQELETSGEMWKKLESVYEQVDAVSRMQVNADFHAYRYDGGPMSVHICQVEGLAARCRRTGVEKGPEDISYKLLENLPEGYSTIRMMLALAPEEKRTPATVKSLLLDVERQLNPEATFAGRAPLPETPRAHLGGPRCFKCNGFDHKKRDCTQSPSHCGRCAFNSCEYAIKSDQVRQLEEIYKKLSDMKDVRSSTESEKARLQSIIQKAEKEEIQWEQRVQGLLKDLQQKEAREKELQAKLLNEVEERERARQETNTAKKQCVELEKSLEQTRKELDASRRQQQHLKEQWHASEQDLLAHLEKCRGREKRLEDQKHNLVDASQQLHDWKTDLSVGESRLNSVEGFLGQTENQKGVAESKSTSVLDDSVLPQDQQLMSPPQRGSPARGADCDKCDKDLLGAVDPLMAQVERERDDLQSQIVTARKQLKEASEKATTGDTTLTEAVHNLRVVQEEKAAVEAKLAEKVVAYNVQAEALTEVKMLKDKIANFKGALTAVQANKKQLKTKFDNLKLDLNKVNEEKRTLQNHLVYVTNRRCPNCKIMWYPSTVRT